MSSPDQGELHATVRAQGLQATGPSGGLYGSELFQHGRGEATVFIPVDGVVRSVGRVVPFTVPPAELAVLVHHGSLDDADITYGELGAYATTHEISVEGPLREYYLVAANETQNAAEWETDRQLYAITIQDTGSGVRTITEANILISAHGILHIPKMPSIPGLDTYKGRLFHSSQWDTSLDLSGKRVAIIGNGSSAYVGFPFPLANAT